MTVSGNNVVSLRKHPGGVAAGLRSTLDNGRIELVSAGPNTEFAFLGSDPYKTNAYTGLVVPSVPSSSIGGARYLFLLARASFTNGEFSPEGKGVKLVGIRQYAELVARIGGRTGPLSENAGPPVNATVTFRKEIVSPLWHPTDGNISWHVMVLPPTQRDTRNIANTDGVVFQDARSPALLYETLGPYTPPNGGRPWGKPFAASLGNIHELRYHWRDQYAELALDIPIPGPCDIALYASVRQNDPTLNPVLASANITQQFTALGPEDQFVTAYPTYAQYGVIAGALVFDQDIGEDVP